MLKGACAYEKTLKKKNFTNIIILTAYGLELIGKDIMNFQDPEMLQQNAELDTEIFSI